MKVEDALNYITDIENISERILSLRDGECIDPIDRVFIVNILQTVKDMLKKSDVLSCFRLENAQD